MFELRFPSKSSEAPATFAQRCKHLYVVQFVHNLLLLKPINVDVVKESYTALQTFFYQQQKDHVKEYDTAMRKKYENQIDLYPYEAKAILASIPFFMVVKTWDIQKPKSKELIAFLIRKFVNGPYIAITPFKGYGLFAEKAYNEGDKITLYGGMLCSEDINRGIEHGINLYQYGRRYNLSLLKSNETRKNDWVRDSELFFQLREAGRWANTYLPSRKNEENPTNAVFGFSEKTKNKPPQKRQLELIAIKPIAKNQEIITTYSDEDAYPMEFFARTTREKASRNLFPIQQCIECNACGETFGTNLHLAKEHLEECIGAKPPLDCDLCQQPAEVACYECQHKTYLCQMHGTTHICASTRSKKQTRSKYPSKRKAREILHHGKVHGRPLTEKQRRYFGWLATRK